jgi:hypothetical protein
MLTDWSTSETGLSAATLTFCTSNALPTHAATAKTMRVLS